MQHRMKLHMKNVTLLPAIQKKKEKRKERSKEYKNWFMKVKERGRQAADHPAHA